MLPEGDRSVKTKGWDASSYARVLDAVREAVLVDDVEGRVVYANQAFLTLFGLERADLDDLRLEDHIAPEWRDTLRDRHARRMRGERVPDVYEYDGLKKSGERMRLQVHVMQVYDQDELIGTQSAIRDLTSARRAEESLRKSHRDLIDVVEALPLAITVLDRDGKVRLWNAAAERMFGWKAEEVLGRGYPLAPDEHEAEHREMLANAIRSGRTYSGHETTRRHRDGRELAVEIWSAPLRNDVGEIEASLAVMLDVSARRRAEHDYRYLFEHAYDAIVIFDPETEEVLEANPTACAMYRLRRDQMIGMSLASVTVDVDRGREAIANTLANRVNTHFDTVHVRADGSRIVLECNASAMTYHGRQAILSINRDVTERRRLEEDLRHAQRLEAMGQLAGGVAHDFNNILAAILGSAEQLKRLASDREAVAHAKAVIAATRRGARLTRQLLTFGRKQVNHPINIDLRDRAVETAGWFARLLGDHVRLAIEPGTEPAVVEIDPAGMEQIVLNLAVNARDAMPDGGTVTIRVDVLEGVDASPGTLDPLPPGDYVLLSVSDEGTGIDDEVLPHLFDPFFTTKPEGKGTGLGLASVYGIVRQAGGSIRVTSEPGKGATFDVFLPRTSETAADSGTFVRPRLAPGSECVLLVEDDDAVRFALENTLAVAGYRVVAATDAGEAERIFEARSDEFDALVTDVHMPGRSGPELATRLCSIRPELPVLYLSGYVGDELRTLLEGAPLVEKPVSGAELTSALRGLLED